MMGWIRKKAPPPAIPPGVRVYAIGDIHGRLDLFDGLLATVAADNAARGAARTQLILLGDLIDRGPESAGVVRRAMRPLDWAETIAIKGNHESAMLDALGGDRAMLQLWLRFGGIAALASWGVDGKLVQDGEVEELIAAARAAVPREERAWLNRMRQAVQIGDYYFVHAGVRPRVPLEKQEAYDAQWIREEFLASKVMHGAVVVHGHSISSEVEIFPNRIGIDTGAYATGRLTALGLEGTSRWMLAT